VKVVYYKAPSTIRKQLLRCNLTNKILTDLKQLLTDIKDKKYDQLLDHSKPDTKLHNKLSAELDAIKALEQEKLTFEEQHHLIYAFCLLDTIHQQYPDIKQIKNALADARHVLTDAIKTNKDYQLFTKQFIGTDLAKKPQDTVDVILKTAHGLRAQMQPGLAGH
jgi:hypothetical protein